MCASVAYRFSAGAMPVVRARPEDEDGEGNQDEGE
jgi:hypothetical protein